MVGVGRHQAPEHDEDCLRGRTDINTWNGRQSRVLFTLHIAYNISKENKKTQEEGVEKLISVQQSDLKVACYTVLLARG